MGGIQDPADHISVLFGPVRVMVEGMGQPSRETIRRLVEVVQSDAAGQAMEFGVELGVDPVQGRGLPGAEDDERTFAALAFTEGLFQPLEQARVQSLRVGHGKDEDIGLAEAPGGLGVFGTFQLLQSPPCGIELDLGPEPPDEVVTGTGCALAGLRAIVQDGDLPRFRRLCR
jgi:hypothetical protein